MMTEYDLLHISHFMNWGKIYRAKYPSNAPDPKPLIILIGIICADQKTYPRRVTSK